MSKSGLNCVTRVAMEKYIVQSSHSILFTMFKKKNNKGLTSMEKIIKGIILTFIISTSFASQTFVVGEVFTATW